jgi:hypothetical protein
MASSLLLSGYIVIGLPNNEIMIEVTLSCYGDYEKYKKTY